MGLMLHKNRIFTSLIHKILRYFSRQYGIIPLPHKDLIKTIKQKIHLTQFDMIKIKKNDKNKNLRNKVKSSKETKSCGNSFIVGCLH